MTASGTFGYGIEYLQLVDIQKIGAIVCKGTTLKPRDGNPQPRLMEAASGLLNSVGLENIGVEAVVRDKAPVWSGWRVPVIVNIAGDTVEEYAQVAGCLEGVPGISGLEINISCPNVACGGMAFGTDPQVAAEVIRAVRSASSLPVIAKLSPNVTSIERIAVSVVEAGAQALTLINTVAGMVIDIKTRRPSLGNVFGGLSGPAIKPIALCMAYKVAGAVDVPIIGCGGIMCAEDALQFLMAGASAVQVGTANLNDPRTALNVADGIGQFLEREGIGSLKDIIGIARD